MGEFRPMRRNRQQMSREECIAVLERGTHGVLSLLGDDGYPYGVPLSYVYAEGKLFFHCAEAGHKLDAVRACGKASFCVVDLDRVKPLEYSTLYRSVISFGKIREPEEREELLAALERLALRYAPEDTEEHREDYIANYLGKVRVLELTVEHMTGKCSLALLEEK